jgi:hypothetical protein
LSILNPHTGLGYNNKRGYLRGTWEYNRNHSLLQHYGISLQEWYQIFDAQGNVCKICNSTEPHGKNWHTDHNHLTGKIRGILCGWCNTALGKFQENQQIIEKAIEYLND